MNYQTVKTHLENAHALLIRTGEELDLHNLGFFPVALKKKDWRSALNVLEECGASTQCDAEFWRELLVVARELELPRYVMRIEKQIELYSA